MKKHERYFFERLECIDERANHEIPNDSNKEDRCYIVSIGKYDIVMINITWHKCLD